MDSIENKQKVLFICTGNSCRSQIAEGLLKDMASSQFEVYSAGSHPSHVHPNAITVMKEKSIDISQNTSDSIDKYSSIGIDTVITVCDNAREACPVFNENVKRIHWSIKDPFDGWNPSNSGINKFRETRNEIESCIIKFINGGKKQ